MRWHGAALALLAGAGLLSSAAIAGEEREAAYQEFRAQFDARQYEAALPLAERVVALTEEQYGAGDPRVLAPLFNLGTTLYRMGRYEEAEEQYLRSIELLEGSGAALDRRLIGPLHGLGAVYLEAGRHEEAAIALKRAVDLSRNLDGLFNPGQVPMLERLVESYVELNRVGEAEKEQEHAFQISSTAFGEYDKRMLRPLERYANWLERIGRYATARSLHRRALEIAAQSRSVLATVAALRGIARTYRLAFVHGPEEGVMQLPSEGAAVTREFSTPGVLDIRGERALLSALEVIDKTEPSALAQRGQILVDLGDWYLSAGQTSKAFETYDTAWQALSRAGSTDALAQPERIVYRPPSAAVSRSQMQLRLDPESYRERLVEVRLTVTRDGRTRDVQALTADLPAKTVRGLESAVRKARYRPRFEDGRPADTAGVVMQEKIALRVAPGSG